MAYVTTPIGLPAPPVFSQNFNLIAGPFTALAAYTPMATGHTTKSTEFQNFPPNFGLGPVIPPEGFETEAAVRVSPFRFPKYYGHGPVVPGKGFSPNSAETFKPAKISPPFDHGPILPREGFDFDATASTPTTVIIHIATSKPERENYLERIMEYFEKDILNTHATSVVPSPTTAQAGSAKSASPKSEKDGSLERIMEYIENHNPDGEVLESSNIALGTPTTFSTPTTLSRRRKPVFQTPRTTQFSSSTISATPKPEKERLLEYVLEQLDTKFGTHFQMSKNNAEAKTILIASHNTLPMDSESDSEPDSDSDSDYVNDEDESSDFLPTNLHEISPAGKKSISNLLPTEKEKEDAEPESESETSPPSMPSSALLHALPFPKGRGHGRPQTLVNTHFPSRQDMQVGVTPEIARHSPKDNAGPVLSPRQMVYPKFHEHDIPRQSQREFLAALHKHGSKPSPRPEKWHGSRV